MKRVLTCSLVIFVIALGASAKMRARYFYAPNHDPNGSQTGSPDVYRITTFQKMIPGIWDGWDDTKGFDGVKTKGDLTNAPYVSAEYWIDSVFEFESSGKRKNAPLVDGWATESDLVDPSYQLSGDGYCVIAAGGLKIEQAGTYEFQLTANDGGMLWIDKNGDGVIDLTSGSMATMGAEIVNRDTSTGGDRCGELYQLRCQTDTTADPPTARAWAFANIKTSGTFPVELSKTGIVKMMIWYWDWGEVGHYELSWKKPGGAMEPISGTNGDLGEPGGGPPVVRITAVSVNGEVKDKTQWGNLDVTECAPVTFTVEASGMQGETPVYKWDFYGNGSATTETGSATITYRYALDPSVFLIQPTVRVQRGSTISSPSSNSDVIFIWLTDDPAVAECDNSDGVSRTVQRVLPGAVRLVGSRVIVPAEGKHEVRLFDAFGRKAVSLAPRETTVDLNKLGLSAGYYVVDLVRNGQKVLSAPVLIDGR